MLRLTFLFLLPALAMGTLSEDQIAAHCVFRCLPMPKYPSPLPAQTCLHLVHNSTATEGNGAWSYDRLVFEGPDCGVYTFVIRTSSSLNMSLVPMDTSNISAEKMMPADRVKCIRACGRGLLDENCAAPTNIISRGSVHFGPLTNVKEGGETVYRAVTFGCAGSKMTTVIRSYRSEFEIRANLVQDDHNSYSELWSINRGFLQTIPVHQNVIDFSTAVGEEIPDEEDTDKNVCALKCVGYKDPASSAPKTCNRTLANEIVADKNGKWGYMREVYEGPQCGVYTFSITTRSHVTMDGDFDTQDFGRTDLSNEEKTCLTKCGFYACDKLSASEGLYGVDGAFSPVFNHLQFACEGVNTVIVRSFRPETVVRIDLERDETPKLYSEKWSIKEGQLVTETAPHGQ